MRRLNLFVLSLVAFLANNLHVHGQILRANQQDANIEVERKLSNGKGGKGGKGKGGKGSTGISSKSTNRRGGGKILLLPRRIEPIPGVNCIPLTPDLVDRLRDELGLGGNGVGKGAGKGGSKSSKGGKGGGKGGQRRNRTDMSRLRRALSSSKGKGGGKGNTRGRARQGGNRRGDPGIPKTKMMKGRLPYCPPDFTFFPTLLPSFTPFPTSTPLPSVTPFPSYTPFPTDDGIPPNGPGPSPAGSPGPGVPAGLTTAPGPGTTTAPGAPGSTAPPGGSTGGAPVAIPPGTERILVESTLQYGFFAGTEVREPTQAELDGLMEQTTNFYTELLRAAYPNLASFEATLVSSRFDAANTDLPIFIEFDANAFFTQGKNFRLIYDD